nr:MAG TPA: hypothetical protein [Caudoviricetes sp.]
MPSLPCSTSQLYYIILPLFSQVFLVIFAPEKTPK